jgi:hypothetical protein
VLGNFPLSPRVRTLLLARNRIAAVQPSLPAAVPNLRNLVLAGNSLGELGDLDVLARFARLTHLVLVDNPVTKKEVCFCLLFWRVYQYPVGECVADRGLWGVGVALSVLGSLALPDCPLSRLPKGQGCRAGKGEGVVWLD